MNIVCFSGQCRNGKDESADHLFKKVDGWSRGAFADSVKDIFCNTFGVDRNFIEQWKSIPEPPPGFLMPVRQSLQFIGDGFRQIQGDIWIKLGVQKNKLIISDGRYINELKAVKDNDGINVVVWRPGFENDDPNPSEAQIKTIVDFFLQRGVEGDVSHDAFVDTFGMNSNPIPPYGAEYVDIFIRNDGSLNDLYQKIEKFVVPKI